MALKILKIMVMCAYLLSRIIVSLFFLPFIFLLFLANIFTIFTDKHKTYESPDLSYDKQKDTKTMLDLSMACSDSKIYTTWSNLKHSSMNKVMTRHPSGNNNTMPDILQSAANLTLGGMSKRSQSLPDLTLVREFQHINIPLNFSVSIKQYE